MAIQRFKVALNNALLPLVSTKAQRAAFVPGLAAAREVDRHEHAEHQHVADCAPCASGADEHAEARGDQKGNCKSNQVFHGAVLLPTLCALNA